MRRFQVEAIDADGRPLQRLLSARDASELAARLAAEGLVLQRLRRLPPLRRLSSDSQQLFCQLLHTLLGAGLPLVEAVEVLSVEADDRRLARLCRELGHSMRSGSSLAAALAAAGEPLHPFALAMVRTGEQTGQLVETLDTAAQQLQWQAALRAQLWRGLSYPLLILALLAAALPLLFVWLVPQLLGFLSLSGAELPWYTRALLATADGFGRGWPAALALVTAAALVLPLAARRSARVAVLLHSGALALPLLGPVLRAAALARLARELGLIYRAGVPLARAVALVAENIGAAWRGVLCGAADAVARGESLHCALAHRLVPPLMVQLVRVGELSGSLEQTLAQAAAWYGDCARRRAAALVETAAPAMLLLAGGLIIWLVAALILPLYEGLFALGAAP